jgi:hypothetical protein
MKLRKYLLLLSIPPTGLLLFLILFFGIGVSFASCTQNDENGEIPTLGITGVSIPNPFVVTKGGEITISGKGFKMNDQVTLISSDSTNYTSLVTAVTDNSMTFTLPAGVISGTYSFYLTRGAVKVSLWKPVVKLTVNFSIPDKAGMSVKGVVYSDGVGIPGVEVSDGIEVTTTDDNGIYYLPSQKKYGCVFISIPGGYEVPNNGNTPQFYGSVNRDSPSVVEQVDFSLTKVDNSKHAVLALADFHLASRNEDLSQFASFAKDVNSTISDLSSAGYRVYIMSLGDESWDQYWYVNSFALPQSYEQMQQLNAPTFHCMGNHDNDPYCASDWLAEQAWLRVCGPCYYSFNLGKVHYIVLDDIQYINTGGASGVIGERNYNELLIAEETAWLQKDLALIVDKSTPIVVGMHAPLFDSPKSVSSTGVQTNSYNLTGASAFVGYFDGFSNVQVLTGHTHNNYNVVTSNTMMEHNTGAVCATWWWTGKLVNNHICCDGTPGGYGVYTFNTKDLSWYYKSKGYSKSYQFRSYDLNTTYINPAVYAPNYISDMTAYAYQYSTPSTANEVLINVWNYDPSWKVQVTENGKALVVTRVVTYDPLHIISYDAQRIKAGGAGYVTFPTELTAHMFKVTASSATSTLNIKVTDRFGNEYTEDMTRPKGFSYDMK